jgi:HD-like signal output (HDOD) protein
MPLDEIARLVELDAGLTLRLLRVANSGLYVLDCTTIREMILHLGTGTFVQLMVFVALQNSIPPSSEAGQFLGESLVLGFMSETEAQISGHVDDSSYLQGLFCMIGRWYLFRFAKSEGLRYPIADISKSMEWEEEFLNFRFPLISHHLLEGWNFPEAITTPIFRMFEPELALEQYRAPARNLRSAFSALLEYSQNPPNISEGPLQETFHHAKETAAFFGYR